VTSGQIDRLPRASSSFDVIARPLAPAPVPKSLAQETGYLLRRAYVHAGRWATAAMPEGVPIRDYEVLQTLADLGPHSQRQLSRLLWVNRTIMVKVIDALESGGLVERRRDPNDRRSYALQLTRAGEQTRSDLSMAADDAEAGLSSPLTPKDRAALRTLLSAIALAAEQPPELPTGLAQRVGFLLTLAHHCVRERVNERLGALGITTTLYGTLATIEARGPTSQQVIADQLGLTGPAIVQTVDRLQAAGLVERRRDPADRRSYALQPTSHGHATLGKARAAIAQINDELDQTLGGKQQRHRLNGLLRKLLDDESTDPAD
jgi:DNA-binding MarR family transcriptional regulator